jgi:hypothetical protein
MRTVRSPDLGVPCAAIWGAGKNGSVSTATASSFLNCPGVRCGTGWSLAWPERVAGAAGPPTDLAAPVSPGLPGVPGPLQLRGRGSGQPPSGAEGPELQVRPGQPPAAFGPRADSTSGAGGSIVTGTPTRLSGIRPDAASARCCKTARRSAISSRPSSSAS